MASTLRWSAAFAILFVGLCFTECQKKETATDSIRDQAQQAWLKASESLTVLAIGKPGGGKSSLVNGILGIARAPEGKGPRSCTKAVVPYTEVINNVTVTVIDTPGLQDPKMRDEDTFEQIRKETGGQVDLVLFCIKMTERFNRNDQEMIQKMNKVFQRPTWDNTLLVLTFANEAKVDNAQEFEKLLQEWKDVLVEALQEHAGLSPDKAQEIPVVPAGYKEPDLPYCEGWRDENKCKNWINHVFLAASKRASTGKKRPLILINRHRFKYWSEVDQNKDLHQIPRNKVIVVDAPIDCIFNSMTGVDVMAGAGGAVALAVGLNLLIPGVGIPLFFAEIVAGGVAWRVGKEVCQGSTLTTALEEVLKEDFEALYIAWITSDIDITSSH